MATETSAIDEVRALIKATRTALGYIDHIPAGFDEPTSRTLVPAVRSSGLDLRSMTLMPPASATSKKSIQIQTSPVIENRSKTRRLDAAVIGNSLVAGLGATVIVAAERDAASSNGIPVFYTDAGMFRAVEPALFTPVADGADAQPTTE